MTDEVHHVDTRLLIQDSHIHIMLYAIVAALQTLLIFGLEWSATWRNTVIIAAFGSGAFDFVGQWLMKAGSPGFSWLTLVSGWLMAAVYVVVLVGRAARGTHESRRSPMIRPSPFLRAPTGAAASWPCSCPAPPCSASAGPYVDTSRPRWCSRSRPT